MSYRLDPALAAELAEFGGGTVNKCFNCGNCTAVCALSKGDSVFPRKIIRYIQLGLGERLKESAEPWLCYYCGGCSDTCPREAHPGELMMATRRWLTSKYDWTGISKRLYLSEAWEIGLLGLVALVVLAMFTIPGLFGIAFGFQAIQGAAVEHVRLDIFAPKGLVHYGDWALAFVLALLLGLNTLRMAYFVLRGAKGRKIPLAAWFTKLPELAVHGLTQKRWLECDNDTRWRWLQHFLLVTGYGTMLLLVVVFLPWFQRDTSQFHVSAILGYYGTVMLLGFTVLAMRGRWRKREAIHRFSHITDWMFLVLLFLTSLSGIALHLFRLLDLPWPTYIMYVAHLMIAVPMLVIEVPFGKWAHLLFRPAAKYMTAVLETSQARELLPLTAATPTTA